MVTLVHYRPQRDGRKRWVIQTGKTTEAKVHTDDSPRKGAEDLEMPVKVHTGDMS